MGLPLFIGSNKCEVFSYLKDRLWKKLSSSKHRLISKEGKRILLKSVGQALSTYCMGTFLVPKLTCDALEKMMNSFWWGSREEEKKGINWMNWNRLFVQKEDRGMGFKNLHCFNLAMLAKQGWRILFNTSSLLAKYFPNCQLHAG
ncbi:hypothetical protein Syun_009329 [Stephania yunnanensis]|uniref:Uncharacterized protein n=1 Tax=Stephania yunnanensis TaxID=152371 RepID=A0AAP0KGY0_9MAGN